MIQKLALIFRAKILPYNLQFCRETSNETNSEWFLNTVQWKGTTVTNAWIETGVGEKSAEIYF